MKKILVISLILSLLISACDVIWPAQPTPEIDLERIVEEAVATALAEFAARVTPTPLQPTPTPVPTEAIVIPTPTPVPTIVIPTPTPLPAIVIPTPTPVPVIVIPTPVPTIPPIVLKPSIAVVAVDRDRAVTMQAENFPANRIFMVRVGPFENFFEHDIVIGSLESGRGGSFRFTALLPYQVRGMDLITLRLDSALDEYAFNAFRNSDRGTVTFADRMVDTNLCEVSISPRPGTVVAPRHEFDVVWTVQNTSDITWEKTHVDYQFISGVEMQKFEKLYDIPQTVNDGETIRIIVDIVAPERPGDYATFWALVRGDTIMCPLPFMVTVK